MNCGTLCVAAMGCMLCASLVAAPPAATQPASGGVVIDCFLDAALQIASQSPDSSAYDRALDYCYLVRKGYALLCRARVSGEMEFCAEALQKFEKACDLVPEAPVAHYLAGCAKARFNLYGDAARHLMRVREGSDIYGQSRLQLASVLAGMADLEEETRIGEAPATRNASSEHFLIEKWQVVDDHMRGRWLDQAVAALEEAERILPNDAAVLLTRGYVHRIQARKHIGGEGMAARGDAAYKQYLAKVRVDAQNWRSAEYVMGALGADAAAATPREVAQAVEDYRRAQNMVRQAAQATLARNSDRAAQALILMSQAPEDAGTLQTATISPDGQIVASYLTKDFPGLLAYFRKANPTNSFGNSGFAGPKETAAGKVCEWWATLDSASVRRGVAGGLQLPPQDKQQEALLRASVEKALNDAGWKGRAVLTSRTVSVASAPTLVAWECHVSLVPMDRAFVLKLMRDLKQAFGDTPSACSEMRVQRGRDGFSLEYTLRAFFRQQPDAVPRTVR